MSQVRVQRALISVSDKLGLAPFARGLAAAGVQLYSTGGTRRHLQEAGLTVEEVSAYTGSPEMMEGRVKTLHPKIHGGILFRRDNAEDVRAGGRAWHRAVRSGRRESVSVRGDRRPAERDRCGSDRADRYRRAELDPRGGEEPSIRRRGDRGRAICRHFGRNLDQRRHVAGTAAAAGRRGVRPHGPIRSGDRPVFCLRKDAKAATIFRPRFRSCFAAKRRCATAKIRISAGALCRPRGGRSESRLGPSASWQRAFVQQSVGSRQRAGHRPPVRRAAAVVIKHNNPCGAATAANLAVAMRRGLGRRRRSAPSAR